MAFFSEVVSGFTLCGNSFAFIPPVCCLKFIVSKDKFAPPHEYLSLSNNFKQDVFFPNTSVIVLKERYFLAGRMSLRNAFQRTSG